MTPICTLAELAKVFAAMAFARDDFGQKLSYQGTLAAHDFTHERWRACEAYWTPIVSAPSILGEPNPQYDAALAAELHTLILAERDRLLGDGNRRAVG